MLLKFEGVGTRPADIFRIYRQQHSITKPEFSCFFFQNRDFESLLLPDSAMGHGGPEERGGGLFVGEGHTKLTLT